MKAIVTTSSLTATSVTIFWSPQPAQFRLPIVEYTVSLTRVTGSGQELCTQVVDRRPVVTTTDTSMPFISLEEFSNYTVTVTTTFNVLGSNMDQVTEVIFTTPSAGINYSILLKFNYTVFHVVPTGTPLVIYSMTSRSIMVTWDTIECIESNGILTGYAVVLQEQDGTTIPGEVMGQSFTANGLTPGTSYTFYVAGVNDVGSGPFTEITINTDEEGYNYVKIVYNEGGDPVPFCL